MSAATRPNPASRASRIVWRWDLLVVFTKREMRIRYRQSFLDIGWSLVSPLTQLAVYGVIFSVAFNVTGEGVPYLVFVWTGLTLWTVFASAFSTGAGSLIASGDLLSKVYFPREVVPLAAVGTAVVDSSGAFALLVVLIAVQVGSVSVTAIVAIPALYVLLVWTSALCVFWAAVTVFVRDFGQVAQIILRVAIFATPVMYGPSVFTGPLAFLVWANPFGVAITAMRDGVLYQVWPDWTLLFVQGAIGTVLAIGAVAYSRSVEARMLDVI